MTNNRRAERELTTEKQLFVGDKIMQIDRGSKKRPPSITIALQGDQTDIDNLIDGLMDRQVNFFSKVPIRGLALTWSQVEFIPDERANGKLLEGLNDKQ